MENRTHTAQDATEMPASMPGTAGAGMPGVVVGESLTQNVRPLLHEIRHALSLLLEQGEATVIDLLSLPLAPGEEQHLLDELGQGEVHARMNALGPTSFIEARYPGVWIVTHFNSNDEVIGKFIEVCEVPDLLRSPRDDIRQGLDQLQLHLAVETT